VSLGVADTLFLATVFALRVIPSIDTFAWPLPWLQPAVPYLGKYVYPTAIVAETGTIYLTILVTVNRYVSVCWPYRASELCSLRSARLHVAAVTLFAVVFNLPRYFESCLRAYIYVLVHPESDMDCIHPLIELDLSVKIGPMSNSGTNALPTAVETATELNTEWFTPKLTPMATRVGFVGI